MIKEGFEILKNSCTRAFGDGRYIILYIISLIFLYIYLKNKEKKTSIVTYSLTSIIIIFNPVLPFFLDKFLTEGVYWRLFWNLPIGFSIAYMFTEIVFISNYKYKRCLTTIILSVFIVLIGTTIYQSHIFQKVNNWFKIPDDELLAINIVLEDSKNNSIDTPKLLVTPDIVAHVRQIDSKLILDYYRNPTGGYSFHSILNKIYDNKFDEAINDLVIKEYDYMIWNKEDLNNSNLSLIGSTVNFNIYKIKTEK